MTDEARERLREENRVRKARSRLNQTRQKKVGLKLKDRNRKQNLSTVNEDSNSTERVRKHRSALKVCLIFKKNKIIHAKKSIKNTLSKLSPHSKVRAIAETCSETLTPKSKFSVAEQVDSVTEDIYQSIANKRDNVSNSARRILLHNFVEKAGSIRSAKRLNRSYSWKSLQNAQSEHLSDIGPILLVTFCMQKVQ